MPTSCSSIILLVIVSLFTLTHGLIAEPRSPARQNLPRATSIKDDPATTTNPFTTISSCSEWNAIITSCEAATPGFSTLSYAQKFSCLCFNGTSFDAQYFDGAANSCANYLSTGIPSLYASISAYESLCLENVIVIVSTTQQSGNTSTALSTVLTTSQTASSASLNTSPLASTVATLPPAPTTSNASTASAGLPGLRALTKRERIGIGAGCGCAGFLVGILIFSTLVKRRSATATNEEGEEKQKPTSVTLGTSAAEGRIDEKAKKEVVKVRSGSLEIASS